RRTGLLFALVLAACQSSPKSSGNNDRIKPGESVESPPPTGPPADPVMPADDPIHDAILNTMSDSQPTVQRAVDYLLEHPEQSQPALMRAWRAHEGRPGWVLYLLGQIGDPESVPLLQDALIASIYTVRFEAAMALAAHPDPSAYAALLATLAHDDPAVKSAAAMGLGRRGDVRACPSLDQLKDDPEMQVRHAVIESLSELGCLDDEQLAKLRHTEQDPLVRELIDRLLAGEPR
ncbi:MAG TPA: HEAT repeat domain-containing protein, partial [Enhygromyxa sp.]|nr:HEAT repeat domain-containing protein [Enhygromyxa sp.]